MEHKYIECGRSNQPAPVSSLNSWLENCRNRRAPYITIVNYVRYADVDWDVISFSMEDERFLHEIELELMKGFIEIFKKHSNTKSRYEINSARATFFKIEIHQVRLLANELFDFLQQKLILKK